MDFTRMKMQAGQWLKKYRYAVIILLVGIVLMTIPSKLDFHNDDTATVPAETLVQVDMADELAKILSQIEGVGQVKVMLTVSAGEKTLYQEDQDANTGENGSSIRTETVIITDSGRGQQALVSQVIPPTYLGAVVVCQGGDMASVKLAILDAVSKCTGLSADKIAVLKMK